MPITNSLSQLLLTLFGVLKKKDTNVIKSIKRRSGYSGNKLIIYILAGFMLAVSFVNVGIANGQTPFLGSPLDLYTPYNAPISSIFDHHVAGETTNTVRSEYNEDNVVVAYSGNVTT